MLKIFGFTLRPLQALVHAIELHQLRRRLPFAYRRLISTPSGMRTESDAEFLLRLREIHKERRSTKTHMRVSAPARGTTHIDTRFYRTTPSISEAAVAHIVRPGVLDVGVVVHSITKILGEIWNSLSERPQGG